MLYYTMAKLSAEAIGELLAERRALLMELSTLESLVCGSVFERFSVCSRPNCSCHDGRRHGPRTYLSVGGSTGQRQHYVPISQVDAAREAVCQYGRLRRIVESITQINLKLLRGGALEQCRGWKPS